jgi:hypothetical protein
MNAKATQVLEVNFIQGADFAGEAAKAAAEALLSAEHAHNSETKAKQSEDNAKASELAAAQSEANAKASELAAKASEDNAHDSEVAADTYQGQAGAYAATAFGASAPAWDSTATYNYPQVVAYTDGKTYRCVGTNVQAVMCPVLLTNGLLSLLIQMIFGKLILMVAICHHFIQCIQLHGRLMATAV